MGYGLVTVVPLMLSAHEGHIRLSAVEQLQALADIFQTDESSFCASRRGSLIRIIHMLFNLPEAFGVSCLLHRPI